MFGSLSEKISKAISGLKGKGLIGEKDFEEFTKILRRAFLEADVSLQVTKEFINNVKDSVIGKQTIGNFSQSDTIVKIIKDELVKILGNENIEINLNVKKPIIIMMVGLQGSGKTTTSAKLALHLRKQHKKNVLLSSLDVYRPAAQKQLALLASQVAVDSIPIVENQSPLEIVKRTLDAKEDYDVIIFDTAGRLHIDDKLMNELQDIKKVADPTEILLVVDAMIGQESLNVAKHFNESLQLTGLILTRLDSDTRGGAALSMRHVTGAPIKFLGSGETINDFEKFHPDRIANRILGMGDIVSLVERASDEIGEAQIDSMKEKLNQGKFDFNDLLLQFKAVNKLGGIAKIMKFIPGINKMPMGDMVDEKMMKRNLAMIYSMTKKERANPDIINQSRKIRIAKGSATKIVDVNKLMKNFERAKSMAVKFSKMGLKNMGNSGIADLFKN